MALQDAQSYAAPFLGSGGPGALEVGYKRMGMEADAGKLAQDKKIAEDKLKQKEKEATQKQADIAPSTVFLPLTMAYADRNRKSTEWLAGKIQANQQGSGGDPFTPGTQEWKEYQVMKQADAQFVYNAKQLETEYGKVMEDIRKDAATGNPWYKPGSADIVNQVYSDPQWAEKGALPPQIKGLLDIEGQITKQFGAIAKEVDAWANQEGTMRGSDTFIPSDAFQTTAETFVTKPGMHDELVDRFALYTPEKQAFISDYAKRMGTNNDVAMVVDMATGLYDRRQEMRSSSQLSAGGAGRKVDERGALWMGKVLQGYMEGIYGNDAKKADFIFGQGPVKDAIMDNTFVGWTWDVKNVYDKKQGKNVEIVKDVKNFVIDPENERFIVEIGNAGSATVTEREVVPFEEAESKLVSRMAGPNRENLKGQGIFDIAAEVTGEGTRKEAGAGNIVKPRTTPKKTAYPTTPESGKKKAY